jgi:hypothetical protein
LYFNIITRIIIIIKILVVRAECCPMYMAATVISALIVRICHVSPMVWKRQGVNSTGSGYGAIVGPYPQR